MRLSCNGCRVLRKGCSENCSIRPCLEWFKNPEAQAHATLFLAKFYGRAGLINLIGAGPLHLRPAIFKSLLYEACGRIVNPIEGSTGLLCSGKWHLCEAAVEAVLTGSPITPTLPATTSQETAAGNDQLISNSLEPSKVCDIRHVCKQPSSIHQVSPNDVLHKSVKLGRKRRVKRCDQPKAVVKAMKLDKRSEIEADSGSSRDGSGVSQMRSRSSIVGGDTGEDVVSGETVEVGVVVGTEVEKDDRRHPGHPGRLMRLAELAGTCDEIDVGLELTLGHSSNSGNQWANGDRDVKDSSDEEDKWNGGLALGFGVVCQYNHDNNHNK